MTGHGKGSAFERAICKRLSLWWTGGERDDVFWRSATSGARATTRSRQGKSTFGQYGDIQATDPIGQPLLDMCTIELKCGYGKASVADVLDKPMNGAQQPWEKWVEQAIADAKKADVAYWMLITRRDRREALIFIPHILSDLLLYQTHRLRDKAYPWMSIDIRDGLSVYATTLKVFLHYITPLNIIEESKVVARWVEPV